jgi:hypothetical protein
VLGADVAERFAIDLHLEHWFRVARMPCRQSAGLNALDPLTLLRFSDFTFHIFGPDAPTIGCSELARGVLVSIVAFMGASR